MVSNEEESADSLDGGFSRETVESNFVNKEAHELISSQKELDKREISFTEEFIVQQIHDQEPQETEAQHQQRRETDCKHRAIRRVSTRSFVSVKSLAARQAMSAVYFQDRDPAELEALIGLADSKDMCAGHFVDYLERHRAADMKAIEKQVASRKALQLNMVKSLTKGFSDFREEVQYEKLEDTFMSTIIRFWRQRGDKRWAPPSQTHPPHGVGLLVKHVQNMVKGFQKRKCLAIDARFYVLRYKLKHVVADGLGHDGERRDRLRDFFKQYHNGQRKVDLQLPSSDGRLRLVTDNPQDAHVAFAKSINAFSKSLESGSSGGMSRPEARRPSKEDPEKPWAPPKPDNWKLRHARGHTPFGLECPRKVARECMSRSVTLPPMPPTTPLGGRRQPGLGSSVSSPLSATWSSPSHSQPTLGGSATLSGGWGMAGRSSSLSGWRNRLTEDEPDVRSSSLSPQKTLRTDTSQSPSKKGSWVDMHRSRSLGGLGGPELTTSRSAPTLLEEDNLSGSPLLSSLGTGYASPLSKSFTSFGKTSRRDCKVFAAPWECASRVNPFISPLSTPETSTGKYLRESELNFVPPKLIPFVTGHSDGLKANGQSLCDTDLLVIGTMLPGKKGVNEIELSGNALLTEKSLVPFLDKTFGQPITKLCIDHCMRHALPPGVRETIEMVASLLVDANGLNLLKCLDLSGIPIGVTSQEPLCNAIQNHPRLTDVRLADIGISGEAAKGCIKKLMHSASIESLDLSWNSFNPEVFTLFGECLAGMYTLKSLSISNCSAAQKDKDNPIAFFMEYLGRDSSLTHLDISTNRISFRGALVIEDALEQHKKLADLTISNNPVGVLGLRCILRLLSRDSSGLVHMTTEGLAGGTLLEAVGEDMQIFRASDPCGRYKLNLARPYHRSMLRMLYKSCERFGVSPDLAFKNITYSEKGGFTHCEKDAEGMFVVPQTGILEFIINTVSIEEGPLSKLQQDDSCDFEEFLQAYQARTRIQVGFKKVVPLMVLWNDLEGRVYDQRFMLDALCKDFAFTWDQILSLCNSKTMITDILWRLLPCVIGGGPGYYLPTRLALNSTEYEIINSKSHMLECFNPDNATGRYKLDLENPSDYVVAEHLILLDRWEISISHKLNRADVSQKGNRSHIRNAEFQDVPLDVYSIAEWRMPEWDFFEVDYISGKRPPAGAPNLDDKSWQEFMVALQQAGCKQIWQLHAFRAVSHHVYISSTQLRQLLSIFKTETIRADVFVVFFTRLTDIANEKVCRVRFDAAHGPDATSMAQKNSEVMSLRDRLGHLTFFPFIQPEQSYFEFNLADHDQKYAAVALLQIAAKESNMSFSNVHDYSYTESNMPLGIPNSWTYAEQIPCKGVFSCTYNCAPEDRSLPERNRLMEQFGFWPSSDAEVNWWSSISSVHEDVMEFLVFLVLKFPNVYDAFRLIDGPGGNGVISWDEFGKGLKKMKFKKFGKDKSEKGKKRIKERMKKVWDFLDPSGDGEVSKLEWSVMEQLFKEVHMSIGEFVWFLDRTFDDLDDAWEFLDEDGSGSLDLEEWLSASKSIGYFGPAKPIFSYLDNDGEGSVSLDEFEVLKEYHKAREEVEILDDADRPDTAEDNE